MAKIEPILVITPPFILGYPNVIQPRQYMEGGKPKGDPKFSMEMIFAPDDMGKFKIPTADGGFEDADLAQLYVRAGKRAFGEDFNAKKSVEARALKWPIVTGEALIAKKLEKGKKRENLDHYDGKRIVSATCSQSYPPSLKYTEGGERKNVHRGLDAEEAKAKNLFYGGAVCIAELSIKGTEVDERMHLVTYFNSVLFVRNGERLGGGSLMDRFDGIDGGESDHDPTAGMDDDIPF